MYWYCSTLNMCNSFYNTWFKYIWEYAYNYGWFIGQKIWWPMKKRPNPVISGNIICVFCLRKSIYRRNMARNKFRKYGSTYWEDNRIQRNKVAAIRKASIAKYFSQKCSSHDKSFWSTVSPFMTDKRHRNGNTFMLQENGKIVIDDKLVANIFND